MLFYFLITIQKLINLLLKQKNFFQKMDDFSKAIALLFFKNWTLFEQFFCQNAILLLNNHTEANKFASKTKFFQKMDDFSKAIALLFFKNWTLFNNDFLSKKHLFHPR